MFYILFLCNDVLFLTFCICLLACVIICMLVWCRVSCVDVDPPVEFEEQPPEASEQQQGINFEEGKYNINTTQ